MTGVVPGTCKIPRQVAKEREKIEARRKASFRELDVALPAPQPRSGEKKDSASTDINALSRQQLMHINRSLNLFSSLLPTQLGLPLDSMLKRKILTQFKYLETDDSLLLRDGSVSQLEMEEVRRACEERGIDVLERNDELLKDALRRWFEARKKSSIERLVLTRPSVWPTKGS